MLFAIGRSSLRETVDQSLERWRCSGSVVDAFGGRRSRLAVKIRCRAARVIRRGPALRVRCREDNQAQAVEPIQVFVVAGFTVSKSASSLLIGVGNLLGYPDRSARNSSRLGRDRRLGIPVHHRGGMQKSAGWV